jgi:hypothetical protein
MFCTYGCGFGCSWLYSCSARSFTINAEDIFLRTGQPRFSHARQMRTRRTWKYFLWLTHNQELIESRGCLFCKHSSRKIW